MTRLDLKGIPRRRLNPLTGGRVLVLPYRTQRPSSMIVVGLSDLTPYGGGQTWGNGHTNEAFRCSLASTDS